MLKCVVSHNNVIALPFHYIYKISYKFSFAHYYIYVVFKIMLNKFFFLVFLCRFYTTFAEMFYIKFLYTKSSLLQKIVFFVEEIVVSVK